MLNYRAAKPKTSKIKKITIILSIIAAIAIMLTAQISNGNLEYSAMVGSVEAATGGQK